MPLSEIMLNKTRRSSLLAVLQNVAIHLSYIRPTTYAKIQTDPLNMSLS